MSDKMKRMGRRYVSYHNSYPYYFNGERTMVQKYKVTSALLLIPVILATAFMIYLFNPIHLDKKKIDGGSGKEILIEDNANIIENEEALRQAFEKFYQETGVIPGIITIENSKEEAREEALSQEELRKIYDEKYEDEYHWLIIYNQYSKEEIAATAFFENAWQSARGTEAEVLLTNPVLDEFWYAATLNAEDRKNVEECFVEALKVLKTKAMDGWFDYGALAIMVGLSVIIWWGTIHFLYRTSKAKRILNAVPCEEDAREIECTSCGGIYAEGTCKKCPYCKTLLSDVLENVDEKAE